MAKYKGKMELITFSDEDALIPVRIGYSLATLYQPHPESHNKYQLVNFGYCPSNNRFYYNDNVHLPKTLIDYFEECEISESTIKALKSAGIYDTIEIKKMLDEYYNTQNNITKDIILNIKKKGSIK
jgi:hypothetical protein